MARFAENELERVKREADLAALVARSGIELRPHGEDLLGLCPFHDDHEPSLVVSPKKGLWHCLGKCSAGGTAIDWVMRHDGLTFREAVVHLQSGATPTHPKAAAKEKSPGLNGSSPRSVSSLAAARRVSPALLSRVAAIYRESYRSSTAAREYATKRGIGSEEAAERFAYGYADGHLLDKLGRESAAELAHAGLVNPRTSRVAGGGHPPPALTEPDLWATHPALWVDGSQAKSKPCPETGPGRFRRCHSSARLTSRLANQAFG
jgi:DNA primase